MRGQAILIHFLRFKYFKNYLKYEKFENIKILFLFFFNFQKNGKNINFCLKFFFLHFFQIFDYMRPNCRFLPQKWLKNILQRWQKVAEFKMWPAGSLCVWVGVLVRKTIFRREGWGRAICICIKKLGGLICYQGHTKRYPLPPNVLVPSLIIISWTKFKLNGIISWTKFKLNGYLNGFMIKWRSRKIIIYGRSIFYL